VIRTGSEHVMGMPISLALRGRHAGDAHGDAAWAAALEVLRAADRTFSTYRADSVISRMNRGVPVDTPPEVADVLRIGARPERSSGGAFALRRDGVLDPSGVVKGWAAERAAVALAALPDTDFCLSAGGDITCRTRDPAAAPWRIGIEDPRDPTRIVAVVPIRTGAVATSGTATAARTSSTPAPVARRAASRP
jgi:thiamine biosynthesis lipoprotein